MVRSALGTIAALLLTVAIAGADCGANGDCAHVECGPSGCVSAAVALGTCCIASGGAGCSNAACQGCVTGGVCVGGANNGVACSAASVCPGGECKSTASCASAWVGGCADAATGRCAGYCYESCTLRHGSCCTSSKTKRGCNNLTCQTCVCNLNTSCCMTKWTSTCAALANGACAGSCTGTCPTPTLTPTPTATPSTPVLLGALTGVGDVYGSNVISVGYHPSRSRGITVTFPPSVALTGNADVPTRGLRMAVNGSEGILSTVGANGTVHIRTVFLGPAPTTRPEIVGDVDTGLPLPAAGLGDFIDVAFNGTVAVAAMRDAGVYVIDATSHSQPRLAGIFDTPGTAWAVDILGGLDIVHIADGSSGYRAIDVTDPETPIGIGSLAISGTSRDVSVVGNTAYLANQNGTFKVVDVTNPAAPVQKASIGLTSFGFFVACKSTQCSAIVGGASVDSLDIIDVTSLTAPVKTGSTAVSTAGGAKGLDLHDTLSYVGVNDGGLRVFDSTPALVATFDDTFLATALDANATQAVLVGCTLTEKDNTATLQSCATGELQVVDTNTKTAPVVSGSLTRTPIITGVAMNAAGSTALITEGSGGLTEKVTISGAGVPSITGTYNPGSGTAFGVALSADGATGFVASGTVGMKVVRVSDMVQLGSLALTGSAVAIDVEGTLAYVLNGASGSLRKVDVSTPGTPVQLGSGSVTAFGKHLACDGTLCVAITLDGSQDYLDVVDVTSNPLKVGSVVLGAVGLAKGVALVGTTAYVATTNNRLRLYDLSTPANPTLQFTGVGIDEAWDVTIADGTAWVADRAARLAVIDLPG